MEERTDKKRKVDQIDVHKHAEKMHPRNLFTKEQPNYIELAKKYPVFQQYLHRTKNGITTIDWKDPEAARELNRILLLHYYGIDIRLPADQLCPPVANRANYIHWLQDLIGENGPAIGLDIGTGASCIYPLLGVKINFPNWSFIATDIDERSLKIAQEMLI